MEALDGNAIAGPLFEYFGSEMTTVPGTCAFCGMTSRFGELRVYIKAPGAVARCPGCGNVVAVIVSVHGALRVDVSAYKLTELSV